MSVLEVVVEVFLAIFYLVWEVRHVSKFKLNSIINTRTLLSQITLEKFP